MNHSLFQSLIFELLPFPSVPTRMSGAPHVVIDRPDASLWYSARWGVLISKETDSDDETH